MRLVADTSAIIAAIVSTEPRHDECLKVLTDATHVFLTDHVATEVCHLLQAAGYGHVVPAFLDDIVDGFYEIVHLDSVDYGTARELILHYEGTIRRKKLKSGSLDLADAMNVVAAARMETTLLASLDQDYRRVSPLNGLQYFTLLPDDSSQYSA